MTKRPRYALLQAFLGDGWTLFSATASDQCHVEVTRGEVPLVTAVANAANIIARGCNVFARDACKSKRNYCGCSQFGFQTFDAHKPDSDDSMVPCCGD